MCPYLLLSRELAFQIYKEYERFSKYFDNIKTAVFFGGISIKKDEEVMKSNCPHIVVGTPGRILALVRDKTLNLKHIKHFILDECDKMLEQLGGSACPCSSPLLLVCLIPPLSSDIGPSLQSSDMRRDVQEVFKMTPHEKQVMMFSATLPKEIRPVAKKFMNNVRAADVCPPCVFGCSG